MHVTHRDLLASAATVVVIFTFYYFPMDGHVQPPLIAFALLELCVKDASHLLLHA